MSIRNLDYLFRPESIAVIGASGKPQTVGATLMRNLLNGGYSRPIMPVNPGTESVAGVMTYPNVARLPKTPDLALICTPAPTVPGLIAELGARGTRAAIVVTAGLERVPQGETKSLQQQMIEAARPYLLRILGPNCVGMLVPGLGINASFAQTSASPGKIAFVTQSGGMVTAVLDWAKSRDIGFSHFISLGNSADVDFGDVVDYLASEPETRSILLYVESIGEARKFMSAARAAARNKPVVAVKAGRAPEGARAAASHTGALAGADEVYDAAIRRAGMLRVDEIEDLFFAVETLARARPLRGERMLIMTNGGGPGVMAADKLGRRGGRLAELSPQTLERLDEVLPSLIVGATTDPVFGPVILFGQGGIAVEVIGDRAVALPPLNAQLASELISRTRISKLLAGYRNSPPANHDAIHAVLIQVSQLVADISEIHELDINPLLADEHGVIALDARVRVETSVPSGPSRLAIRPYPRELDESLTFHDRPLMLRPIRPEDEPAHHDLFRKLDSEDVRFRFFHTMKELPRSDAARYTQIDYDREMAFVATRTNADGHPETLGVVRAIADPDNAIAEFAIVIRSDLKGLGLGSLLMDKIIRFSRGRGIGELRGEVLDENRGLQSLARKLGFAVAPGPEAGTRALRLKL